MAVIRKQILLPDDLCALVEDYRFSHRIPTWAAAVRELIEKGLEATEDDWQPIETAPKDGTAIILWAASHQIGIWFDGTCEGRWETLDGVTLEEDWEPTHWKWLPDPPTKEKDNDRNM